MCWCTSLNHKLLIVESYCLFKSIVHIFIIIVVATFILQSLPVTDYILIVILIWSLSDLSSIKHTGLYTSYIQCKVQYYQYQILIHLCTPVQRLGWKMHFVYCMKGKGHLWDPQSRMKPHGLTRVKNVSTWYWGTHCMRAYAILHINTGCMAPGTVWIRDTSWNVNIPNGTDQVCKIKHVAGIGMSWHGHSVTQRHNASNRMLSVMYCTSFNVNFGILNS